VLITANDVLHARWVPAFGVKQDAVPGFIRDSWFRVEKPGTYRGQCAELCGKEHGFMPIVVVAIEQKEFAEWAAKQKTASAAGGATTVAPAGAAGQTTKQALTADSHPEGFARVIEEKQ
jgi:heme/copper-type cytochrome/quinol oxidase subunit 2